jgi:hypothetical protein
VVIGLRARRIIASSFLPRRCQPVTCRIANKSVEFRRQRFGSSADFAIAASPRIAIFAMCRRAPSSLDGWSLTQT